MLTKACLDAWDKVSTYNMKIVLFALPIHSVIWGHIMYLIKLFEKRDTDTITGGVRCSEWLVMGDCSKNVQSNYSNDSIRDNRKIICHTSN